LNLTVGTTTGQSEVYSISSNVPWLSLSNATGTAPGSGVAVIVSQTAAASLPTGLSTGQLTISGSGYISLVVQVTLTLGGNCVSGTGAITSDTSAITSTIVANAQDVKFFNITNDTNAPLNVTATISQTVATSQPWLRVSPGVVTLPVNSPVQFTVNIFPAGILTPGQSYTAMVTITPQTSGLAAIVIPVTLNYATGTGNTALISTPPVIAYPLPTGTSAATSLSVIPISS
jgi:hypothetical protein